MRKLGPAWELYKTDHFVKFPAVAAPVLTVGLTPATGAGPARFFTLLPMG